MENRWLGLIALTASILIAFVWVPYDVETGLIEKVRRSVQIGDAFAPTMAAFMIGLGGFLVLIARSEPDAQATILNPPSLLNHFHYALASLLIIAIGLGLMRYSGPLVVAFFNTESIEYRLLRDTVPWKYVGFIIGGTFLVTALIAWTERKLKWTHVLTGFATTLILIAIYDLPFDDLLLPPNGDV